MSLQDFKKHHEMYSYASSICSRLIPCRACIKIAKFFASIEAERCKNEDREVYDGKPLFTIVKHRNGIKISRKFTPAEPTTAQDD